MKTLQVTKFQKTIPWLVILALALLTRFFDLTNKPIHFDESINGWFVMQMKTMGFYRYDPNNYHGPMHFYIIKGFDYLFGTSLWTLRAVPSFFGVLGVMLFTMPILRSKSVLRWMIFLTMLSPAFLFYARSGIHEMPFVFFQMVFALGLLRWGEKQDSESLGLLIAGLIGMMTLKETFVINLASWAVGIVLLGPQEWRRQFTWQKIRAAWTKRVTWWFVVALLWFVAFFSGFFHNPAGLLDFVRAFLPWMKTGVGENGHNKEFWYWIKVLYQAEPFVLVGVIVAIFSLRSKNAVLRMVSAYSLVQLLVYSAIPYKTVWCIITLAWGFYLVLALVFAQYAVKTAKNAKARYVIYAVTVVFTLLNIKSDYECVYSRPLDLEHPYIYVNSTYNLKNVQNLLLDTLERHPELKAQGIQVGMPEQWPWPWVLRDLPNVHYDICDKRVEPNALVYFCDLSTGNALEAELQQPYIKLSRPMRQSRENSLVYLRKDVFEGAEVGPHEVVGPVIKDESKAQDADKNSAH